MIIHGKRDPHGNVRWDAEDVIRGAEALSKLFDRVERGEWLLMAPNGNIWCGTRGEIAREMLRQATTEELLGERK